MDYQKFSKQLVVALASDARTHRLLDPSIIPNVAAVVIDTLAEFEGKNKTTLPPPKANPPDTIAAVTHIPPVYDNEGNEIVKVESITKVVEPKPAPIEKAKPISEAIDSISPKAVINFWDMKKEDLLGWYEANKEEYNLNIEGIDDMKVHQIKKILNKEVNG